MDDGDREKFCEAIADATHYVAVALDVLPRQDHFSFPELCRALNYLNDLNDEIQAHLCDADDAGDIDPTDCEQLATELMRGCR
jgi:chromosome condensin MukBEF ATPase and DNA-binding subunit MukB